MLLSHPLQQHVPQYQRPTLAARHKSAVRTRRLTLCPLRACATSAAPALAASPQSVSVQDQIEPTEVAFRPIGMPRAETMAANPKNHRDRSEGVGAPAAGRLAVLLIHVTHEKCPHPIAGARDRFAAHAHNGNWLSISSSASSVSSDPPRGPRLAAPTNKWVPTHYFGRPKGKLGPP